MNSKGFFAVIFAVFFAVSNLSSFWMVRHQSKFDKPEIWGKMLFFFGGGGKRFTVVDFIKLFCGGNLKNLYFTLS